MEAIVTAVGLVIVALIGAYSAFLQRSTQTIAKDTHRQVVTLNESTIGELAAADETRRAKVISRPDRTAMEQRHIDTAPPIGPPQGGEPDGRPLQERRLVDTLAHVEQVSEEIHHAVNGEPPDHPSLYELMQGLAEKIDTNTDRITAIGVAAAQRLAQLESTIGLPADPPETERP